ncbi:LOW QUALITY PROTEIN: seed biotin-containing protein SBP65-like [Prosopis cineraria]|uniref:LOW QUALITY PROTEIN: seed biotin-containing protein SBP65-like n=1 Tax=Prosopis cineraria TaxID=364024 RepID=UPI002410617E|nr:LOW QUALITY PROTEIN: seed biotin-containing protein SBP65-like [Prosopis cineraria]
MASEQVSRRENTTTEREVHIEKDRVPKMTTHFEHLAEQVKEGSDTPQGSIQELQGGEYRKEHGGRAIGDIGGTGKARETHELGPHFESLADKVKGEKGEKKESYAAKVGNTAPFSNVGQFEGKAEANKGSAGGARGRDQSEPESRSRVVNTGGPTQSGVEKQARENRGQVEAEKGRRGNKGQVEAEEGRSWENRGRLESEEKLGTRGTESGGEVKGRVGVETQGPTAVITCTFEGGEKEEDGRDARGLESATERARREENRGRGGDQEKESQSTLEDISKYRGQVQENTMEAMRAAQERYERAKQAANETVGSTTQTTQEKAAQAKDIAMEKAAQAKDYTLEKGQQGYATAKDTISSATQTASDYTSQAAKKAAQAKDVTLEKGQQGYASAKDTISSATQTAADYTSQAAEKAKSAGSTTTQYVGEKAGRAKDVTLETGKTAAEYAGKLAADLKDKATVAGWTAAHYSTEKTVEGTKAAANIVQGTAGYAANKASELASKSLGAVKGLAARAGETAKDYTARKKEEAEKDYETKKASQPQETERRPSSGQEQGQKGGGMSKTSLEAFRKVVGLAKL